MGQIVSLSYKIVIASVTDRGISCSILEKNLTDLRLSIFGVHCIKPLVERGGIYSLENPTMEDASLCLREVSAEEPGSYSGCPCWTTEGKYRSNCSEL